MGNCYFRLTDPGEDQLREILNCLKIKDSSIEKLTTIIKSSVFKSMNFKAHANMLRSEFYSSDPLTNPFLAYHKAIFDNIMMRFSRILFMDIIGFFVPYLVDSKGYLFDILLTSQLKCTSLEKFRIKLVSYIVFHCHTVTMIVYRAAVETQDEIEEELSKVVETMSLQNVKAVAEDIFDELNPADLQEASLKTRSLKYLVNFLELREVVYEKCKELRRQSLLDSKA